ncbi:MAG: NAD(P)/FAD-dependent oxidoreductase [Methanolinea sp.]|nr:NAD(P)/FAD-dependent oxidoreductase [Methanolinea sp.]
MAAMQLGLAGKEVTLVEKKSLGGQCLHHGCMVVCALNDVARTIYSSRSMERLGITQGVPRVCFPELLAGMAEIQEKIGSVLDAETRGCGVEIWYGRSGRLEGRRVFIDEEPVNPEGIIVATGSFPRIPEVPGISLKGVYDPHTLSRMPAIPERLLIIGGGIMAAEFAFIFQEFGSRVCLAARTKFLAGIDPKLRDLAVRDLSSTEIRENCRVESLAGIDRVEGAVLRSPDESAELPFDAVLVAAGLVPNSGMVQGIAKGKDGRIQVDRYMRTSVTGVWACGDVTGSCYLTPVARREGMVAAACILGKDDPMDYEGVPQSMALASDHAFIHGDAEGAISLSIPGPAGPGTFWGVSSGRTGMARVLVDPASGAIRGISASGPSASIIAAYQAFLMKKGITVHDFDQFTEVHPMSDGVYSLMKYASSRLKKGNLKP